VATRRARRRAQEDSRPARKRAGRGNGDETAAPRAVAGLKAEIVRGKIR